MNNCPPVSTSTELDWEVVWLPAENVLMMVIDAEFEITKELRLALAAFPTVNRPPLVQDDPLPLMTSLEGVAVALFAMIVACATTVPLVRYTWAGPALLRPIVSRPPPLELVTYMVPTAM